MSRTSSISSRCSSKTRPYFLPHTSFSSSDKYDNRLPVLSSCGAEEIKVRISFIFASKSSRFCLVIFPVLASSTVALASSSETVPSSKLANIESIVSNTPNSSYSCVIPIASRTLSSVYSIIGLPKNSSIPNKILIAKNHLLFFSLSHSATGENCFFSTISDNSSLISS